MYDYDKRTVILQGIRVSAVAKTVVYRDVTY